MALGGATELIWHFAGYLRLPPEDYATTNDLYDGAALRAIQDDGAVAGPVGGAHGYAPPNLGGGHLPTAALVAPEVLHWHTHHIGLSRPPHPHLHGTKLPLPGKTSSSLAPMDGSSAGGEITLQVTASYHQGATQELVDLHQVNILVSDNRVDAPADVFAQNSSYAADTLASMLDQAHNAAPSALQVTDTTTAGLEQLVNSRDAHPVDTPTLVPPGGESIYVDGHLTNETAAQAHQATVDALTGTAPAMLPGIPTSVLDAYFPGLATFPGVFPALNAGIAGPPVSPAGDGSIDSLQVISVGKDIAANVSLVSNLEPLTATLVVTGNYYETQEIVQTNVFTEADKFNLGGTSINTIDQNVIKNIADFANQPATLSSSGPSGPGPTDVHWSVDVVNGSFLNINSLVQTNYLTNDNVVYQTDSFGHSQIIAGGNVQVNEAQFASLTTKYDLIIVEGNYHQDDMIYQTNVLLDGNTVGVVGNGTGTYSANGGGNTVINDASIVDMGNHSYQLMSDSVVCVLNGLEEQHPNLDATQLLNAFPQLFGNINVLVVNGDFYDINYLQQTNVISNSNIVMVGGTEKQIVQTGHDVAVNVATIVDGGSVNSYLGGHYYNDMILIQTNIIGDGTKIAGQDPNHLAPEIIAFTGTTDAGHQAVSAPVAAPIDLQHHNDPMSSVLH
jgi:hypothetical protein